MGIWQIKSNLGKSQNILGIHFNQYQSEDADLNLSEKSASWGTKH